MANKPNDENEPVEESKEKIRAIARLFKKLSCPYCGTELTVEQVVEHFCPTCEEIIQAEKRNSLN